MEGIVRMHDQEVRAKLQTLIEAEADPRERARLMIMLQISDILIDNVRAVRGMSDELHVHRTEFSMHMKKELELINQGKGMWKVFAVVISAIQLLIGYSFNNYINDMTDLKQTKVVVERRLDSIEHKIGNIQKSYPN